MHCVFPLHTGAASQRAPKDGGAVLPVLCGLQEPLEYRKMNSFSSVPLVCKAHLQMKSRSQKLVISLLTNSYLLFKVYFEDFDLCVVLGMTHIVLAEFLT